MWDGTKWIMVTSTDTVKRQGYKPFDRKSAHDQNIAGHAFIIGVLVGILLMVLSG